MKPQLLVALTAGVLLAADAPGRGAARPDGGQPAPVGASLARLNKAFARRADAEIPLNLTTGEPLLMLRLRESPSGIGSSDPLVLDFTIVGPRLVALKARGV